MMTRLRRFSRMVRGAIGMGMTWAVGWFGAGMIVRLIVGSGTGDLPIPIQFAMFGLFAGVTFSGFLRLAAGRRRFDELSLGRFTGWGAVGGLIMYGILAATAGPAGEPLVLAPVLALAGAASAAGTLSLARKAEGATALEAGSDPAAIDAPDRAGHLS